MVDWIKAITSLVVGFSLVAFVFVLWILKITIGLLITSFVIAFFLWFFQIYTIEEIQHFYMWLFQIT